MTPYYQKNGIVIYHADCREILPAFEVNQFGLVLTDPPYGVSLGTKSRNQKSIKNEAYKSFDDSLENVLCLANDVMPQLLRVSNRVVLTPGVKNMWSWPKPTHVGSFFYPSGKGCNSWGFTCWQPIFFYGDDPYGGKGSRPDSLFSTDSAARNGHPCPKPIGQWSWLLGRTSTPSDVVLDPFMGSGTTLRACKDFGLHAVGIEIEERYCEIAARELAQDVLCARHPNAHVFANKVI